VISLLNIGPGKAGAADNSINLDESMMMKKGCWSCTKVEVDYACSHKKLAVARAIWPAPRDGDID
jgi:hypothetical protein